MKVNIPRNQTKYIGQCIYCPRPGITREHIVPESFGGHHILRDGSCIECAHMTRDRETALCEYNFNAIRFHRGYRTRGGRAKKREPDLRIIEGETPHDAPFRKIRADKAPGVSVFPIFPPPGIMRGQQPTETEPEVINCQIVDSSGDGAARQRNLMASGFSGALTYSQISPSEFMRVLAKIAHGYAVWEVGLNGFNPLLLPIIHGTTMSVGHLIGCNFPDGPLKPYLNDPSGSGPYQISPLEIQIEGERFLTCQIRLFASVRPLTPVYVVSLRGWSIVQMTPTCSTQTLCGFFLAAFGVALGWGFGLFVVAQVTRLLVRLFGSA